MNFDIRLETPKDHRDVENLTREAFYNHHSPGCTEHLVVHQLRKSPAFIEALDFVAFWEGQLVGNIMYVHARVQDGDRSHDVLSFGPLSVLPAFQRRGVGSALIRHSVQAARALSHSAIIIYGSPAYYARFGFMPARQFKIYTPDRLYLPALMAMELVPGALDGVQGAFQEGDAYHTTDEAVAAFDAAFPPKEKVSGTPSQLDFEREVAAGVPVDDQ